MIGRKIGEVANQVEEIKRLIEYDGLGVDRNSVLAAQRQRGERPGQRVERGGGGRWWWRGRGSGELGEDVEYEVRQAGGELWEVGG